MVAQEFGRGRFVKDGSVLQSVLDKLDLLAIAFEIDGLGRTLTEVDSNDVAPFGWAGTEELREGARLMVGIRHQQLWLYFRECNEAGTVPATFFACLRREALLSGKKLRKKRADR